VAGLIDVQARLQRDALEELLVRSLQRAADLGDELDRIAARERFCDHVTEELADGRERGVADVLQVGDQGRQAGLEQPFLAHGLGPLGVMDLAAPRAPVGVGTVLLAGDDDLTDLGLLGDVRGDLFEPDDVLAGAVRAGRGDVRVDLAEALGRIRRAGVLGMTRLSADGVAQARCFGGLFGAFPLKFGSCRA
jgi:hypothetical protein